VVLDHPIVTKKTGVLLVNLGSPDAPTRPSVRRYLKEFLSDPRVVNLPRALWWIILHFLVLPFRSGKSAKTYQQVWTEEGAPLILFTRKLTEKVAGRFNNKQIQIEMAMRYGEPRIAKILELFKQQKIERLLVIPLYPQYSSTTTASVYDEVFRKYLSEKYIPETHFINDYHFHPLYIKGVADKIKEAWQLYQKGDLLILSFHGLPAKLSEWGDPYENQCHTSGKLIAEQLNIEDTAWKIVFQSRFGKAEWLQPYCVDTLRELPIQGIKNIDIVCPGFSVDCLETLEEIAMTNRAVFLESGGESFRYIPALNADDSHVELLENLIVPHCEG
jgi:ferrochelatase